MSHDPCNATLVARRDLDAHHTVFTVRPDRPLEFIAGQWTELGLPKVEEGQWGPSGDEFVKDGVVRRAYSICSSPGGDELEFYFNRVDTGQLTRWLWEVPVNGRLFVDPEARGHFTLDAAGAHPGLPADARPDLLFVATGTGLAPFLSLLRQHTVYAPLPIAPEDHASGSHVPWRSLVLLHGARHRALLAFEDELRAIAAKARYHVCYLPVLSREPAESDWPGLRGRVTDLAAELFASPNDRRLLSDTPTPPPPQLDPARCHAYLCGNSTMITMIEGELMPLGMVPRWEDPEGTIHTEVYY